MNNLISRQSIYRTDGAEEHPDTLQTGCKMHHLMVLPYRFPSLPLDGNDGKTLRKGGVTHLTHNTYKWRTITKNNTLKKLAAVFTLAAICLSLTACNTQPAPTVPTTVPETTVPATTVPATTVPATTVPETTVPETTVPETTVPDATAPIDEPALSGNWSDMQFTLDGVLFQLPTTVKELEAAGWTVDLKDEEDFELEFNTKLVYPFSATHPDYPGNFLNTVTVYAYFWNDTEESLPLKECGIYMIEVDALYPMQKGNAYPTIVLSNGLKLGDSLETVEALCGEAYHTYESDLGYTTLTYCVDDEDVFFRSYFLSVTVYKDYGVAKIELKISN